MDWESAENKQKKKADIHSAFPVDSIIFDTNGKKRFAAPYAVGFSVCVLLCEANSYALVKRAFFPLISRLA